MKRLIQTAAILCTLVAPAFAAGTAHVYVPRSKFHPFVGSTCTPNTLSGGGGLASMNKDVLDCPAANFNAFLGFEFWFPQNSTGNTIGLVLYGESDQSESGVWCNLAQYEVTPTGANGNWEANDGRAGGRTDVGAPVLTGGPSRMFRWPANGVATVTAWNQQNNANCTNATPSDCAGYPGVVFVRRGVVGTDTCGAGTDIGHTVHYIGADVSWSWP